jgi:pilus assembly protein Flp/PilA
MKFLNKMLKDENGGGLVEYCLIVAIIGIGCIVVMGNLRTALNTTFTNTTTQLNTASAMAG